MPESDLIMTPDIDKEIEAKDRKILEIDEKLTKAISLRNTSMGVLNIYISQEKNGENQNKIEEESEKIKHLSAEINKYVGEKKVMIETVSRLKDLKEAKNIEAREKFIKVGMELKKKYEQKDKEAIESERIASENRRNSDAAKNEYEKYLEYLATLNIKLAETKLVERVEKNFEKKKAKKDGERLEDAIKGGSVEDNNAKSLLKNKQTELPVQGGLTKEEEEFVAPDEAETTKMVGGMSEKEFNEMPNEEQQNEKPVILTNIKSGFRGEPILTSEDSEEIILNDTDQETVIMYTIKDQDTLGAIAKKAGISVDEIISMNPEIKDRHKIFAGKKIQFSVIGSPEHLEKIKKRFEK